MQRENKSRSHGGRERPGGGRPDARKKKRKVCYFCANKATADYKNPGFLGRFLTDRGKIMTVRSSGCCSKHQRALAKQIKRARQVGFLPYTVE